MTRDAHAAVDSLVGTFDLTSRGGYASFLQVHASVILPAEASLVDSGVEDHLEDWHSRTRSAAIEADLRAFGVSIAVEPKLPFDIDFARALGVLYVLEGSRLGSAFLLRSLEDEFENAGYRPTRFLRHNDQLPLWPTFLRWLGQQRLGAEEADAAVGATTAMFRLYEWNAAKRLDASARASR